MIYQAIVTKYLGPINYRGARIKATTEFGVSLTMPYLYELPPAQCHKVAAVELATKLQWPGVRRMIQGALKGGYVFVFPDDEAAR